MFHPIRVCKFSVLPKPREKPLADRRMLGKRIGVTNTDQLVSKKNKIVQSKIQAAPEADYSPSKVTAGKTSRVPLAPTSGKRGAMSQKIKVIRMPTETGRCAEPPEEEIRLRAYFISERRRRLALPGDAESDWLEAKRQLVSESGLR
jgi:hypothetical protein